LREDKKNINQKEKHAQKKGKTGKLEMHLASETHTRTQYTHLAFFLGGGGG
jgi:hypothetical protein